MEITPSTTIESLRSHDLFALVVPGGWAPDKLRRFSVVIDLVREMDTAGKIIGIMCHSGLVAISAGIVLVVAPRVHSASRMTLPMPRLFG